MAYKIKKQHNIIEDIELLAEDNSVSMTIHVDINPDAIAKDYRHIQLELIHAQKAVNNKSDNAFEQFEKAVISMFNLIFGEKNTDKLLEYFDGEYTEMSVQLAPFITNVVQPAIKQSVKNKKSIIANNYNLSRAQKRKLGL